MMELATGEGTVSYDDNDDDNAMLQIYHDRRKK